ncbi:Pyruvate:ferredoxin oxidoreductase [Blattamonas nauphoetae]|uniref:Pyruvate:ferredoxin oxidoreductase n=1 Tax=Blattamonas nauphoetae TaxID=2049346 RepID=A0ABQ9Y689_9EUKA|nr:Pyruvate:ferredoxin oxidoreductase [Blattamonas nauphoetae]
MEQEKIECFDGNSCAAHVAYALSDNSVIFPITPSSVMGELIDEWAAAGRKNIFDQVVSVTEMQSEAGAAGAVHGSLAAGALTSTYTASQGLLLMVPNMYKIAGEKLPAVFHVTARAVAGQALSIFGDHSDVMATRQTGFALLNSATVQEVMDLALVSHLAAIKVGMPFVHFFDGFRTSHEVQKVKSIPYSVMKTMVDYDAIKKFHAGCLNPEHPQMRGTSQSPDIFFALVESSNKVYQAIPDAVQAAMDQVAAYTKRPIHLFDYVGHPEATHVIVCMGAAAATCEDVANHLNAQGSKVGVLKVRLYRPWDAKAFLATLPKTATHICVLDRTKEPGSFGEPLYLDVAATIQETGESRVIIGGRFGLGSKDLTGAMAKAVFDNLASAQPKRHFTVGINDDITFTSLPLAGPLDSVPKGTVQCLIWGLGSDGTVGANKEAIKLIGSHTEQYCQGYFEYDAKKSGGLTRSHLRFGTKPINATYLVDHADYVACHHPGYVGHYHLLRDAREGSVFVLNSPWNTIELMEQNLTGDVKRDLANKKIKLYNVDAWKIAAEAKVGKFINMIMQTAFFKLSGVLPFEEAIKLLKDSVVKMYSRKGDEIVQKNINAIDLSLNAVTEIPVPAEWANAAPPKGFTIEGAPQFVNEVMLPCSHYEGAELPISTLLRNCEGGIMPTGTAAFEKRGLAVTVPKWNAEKCVQCTLCSVVCPHAVIRPFLVTPEEQKAAPQESFVCVPAKGKEFEGLHYRMQVSPLDCTGCGVCAQTCPVKALDMTPLEEERYNHKNWEYAITLPIRDDKIETTVEKPNLKASQFKQPLLEFSGACGGCGETPYIKLITQLFGDRMIVANATGCSSIWGGSAPWCPYTVNKDGHGPAWGNSLFEDNAEYGYGMFLATTQRRKRVLDIANKVVQEASTPQDVKDATQEWIINADNAQKSKMTGNALKKVLAAHQEEKGLLGELWDARDLFTKKSQWIFGGDGWAYDIGYGGLDHVLACNDDVNIFVLDTEVYSNTGGQRSKATPRGAQAKFAASGKKTSKKNLGLLAMTYGYIYVAQVAIGANQMQCLRAIQEAEAFPGPSLIVAYAPCLNHGIKGGLVNMVEEEKQAVKFGYWHLFRYNPLLAKDGKNPFSLDSPKPSGDLKDFLYREVRYDALTRQFQDEAERLHTLLAQDKQKDYERYEGFAKNGF